MLCSRPQGQTAYAIAKEGNVTDRQNIFVVDSDPDIRRRLQVSLAMANFDVKTFASTVDFLADPHPKEGCLIIDLRSGLNWLELEIELAKRHHDLVVLVINDRTDIPLVIGAMSMGAVHFIEKPFDGEQIVASVRLALDTHAKAHCQPAVAKAAKVKIAILTPRERSVADKLVLGMSNKVVAHELGISPRTIEVHRARIMEKLKLSSLSDLVRLMHAVQVDAVYHQTDSPRLAKQG
jgi:two-component system, LuxR family, response regulator FixJ